MSSGRGVGVWLPELLEAYDADALRYYVSAAMPEMKDSEFSFEDLARRINTELVAIYGNFVHRVLTFTHKNFGHVPPVQEVSREDQALLRDMEETLRRVGRNLEYCHFKDALREIMALARKGNQFFDSVAPWDLVKADREACGSALHVALRLVKALAVMTAPFLPFSAERLWGMLGFEGSIHHASWEEALEEITPGPTLAAPTPLFKKVEEPGMSLEDEAERLDVRVGKVLKVDNHPKADKLYLVDVDLGKEKRRLVAGIRDQYTAKEVEGKTIVVLCNLKPAVLRGIRSEGMLLAAVDGEQVSLLLAGAAAPGTRVLGTESAPEISYEEFRKLKMIVDEKGTVLFLGTQESQSIPLMAGGEGVTVDRQIRPGSEVT